MFFQKTWKEQIGGYEFEIKKHDRTGAVLLGIAAGGIAADFNRDDELSERFCDYQ